MNLNLYSQEPFKRTITTYSCLFKQSITFQLNLTINPVTIRRNGQSGIKAAGVGSRLSATDTVDCIERQSTKEMARVGHRGRPVPCFFNFVLLWRWKRSPFKWWLANDSPTLQGLNWLASRSQPASDGNFNPLIGVQLFCPCFFSSSCFLSPTLNGRIARYFPSTRSPPLYFPPPFFSVFLHCSFSLFSFLLFFLYKRKEKFY